MNNITIPFLDLITPHLKLEAEFIEVFRDALRTGRFIGGPNVESFETEFASFCGTAHCIGVGSGTDALRFALIAAGVGKGDAVVTVPNTFIASTEAISQAGAVPVFVDIDERTYNMDPSRLREYLETQCDIEHSTGRPIDRRTGCPIAAIVPVHLYGQSADMDSICEIAGTHNLLVIEDACQAHGAAFRSSKHNGWKRAGSMGVAAAFSFYPGKNLGAFGEAGAVTTNNAEIADNIRMLRDHGQKTKYYHEIEGYNGRLDSIQAGVLNVKLKHLEVWNAKRRENAQNYDSLLGNMDGITIPFEPSWSRAVYHLYVIRTERRDDLQKELRDRGFFTGLHYPLPLHLQNAYAGMGYEKGDFPTAEKTASEILSLPMYPELSYESQKKLSAVIGSFAL